MSQLITLLMREWAKAQERYTNNTKYAQDMEAAAKLARSEAAQAWNVMSKCKDMVQATTGEAKGTLLTEEELAAIPWPDDEMMELTLHPPGHPLGAPVVRPADGAELEAHHYPDDF